MNGSDVGPSYGEPDEDKDKGQQEDWESSELFVSRSNLVLENLALRQQLTVRASTDGKRYVIRLVWLT